MVGSGMPHELRFEAHGACSIGPSDLFEKHTFKDKAIMHFRMMTTDR